MNNRKSKKVSSVNSSLTAKKREGWQQEILLNARQ
jgi:hypothetical protein